MYEYLLVRGNYKNAVFLQTFWNGDKSAPHQDRSFGSVSKHTVIPDSKEGGDHGECTMAPTEEEGCEVVKDVIPFPAAGPGIMVSHAAGVSLEDIKKLIQTEDCLLGWVEQLEETAHLINHNESKFYSSILKSIRKHINHPFQGEFSLMFLGSPDI